MKKTLKTEVAIIGAGPAGLSLAMFLSQLGVDFICIDRKAKPTDFTTHCSCSLINPKEYGLSDNIYLQNWNSVVVHLPNHPIEAKAPASYIQKIGYLDRSILYQELFEKANAGRNFLFKELAAIVDENHDGSIRSIETATKIIQAKIYADCSGAHGFLSKRYIGNATADYAIGIEHILTRTSTDPNTLQLYLGGPSTGGYGWVAPTGSCINVGIGKFRETLAKEQLGIYLKAFIESDRMKGVGRGKFLKKFGGIFPTNLLSTFHYQNTIHIGDSVGHGNPVFGEGIRWAIEFSKIAAPIIKDAITTNRMNMLAEYTYEWNRKYRQIYTWGKFFRERARHADFNRSVIRTTVARRILENSSDDIVMSFFGGAITPQVLVQMIESSLFGDKKR